MKLYTFIIIFFICFSVTAQKEAYNWLFGANVGLRFNDDGTKPTVQFGELNTLEGCASISDSNGNLLFYSDGSNVWTRNGQLMPNGTGLLGDESSSQSGIIVPKPKDPNIYYLFTVGSTLVPSGFHYYTIDMSMNGGMGDVVAGSEIDLTDGHPAIEWSEKITAVQGSDCNVFWVISLVKDLYYAYRVDRYGVSRLPIISKVNFLSNRSRGYLKVSPDGNKLAAAHQGSDSSSHGLFLYSFNNVTGVVSEELNLFPNEIKQVYGVEFSSQSSKLYASTINDDEYELYQFDLKSNNIPGSSTLIHREQPAYRGALQLGVDQKIYVTIPEDYTVGTNYIDVIYNPELDGTNCRFIQDYIYLGNNNFSMQGLPPFIQSYFKIAEINIINPYLPISFTGKDLIVCKDESFTLEGLEIDGAEYYWSFENGSNEIALPTPTPPYRLTIDNLGDNIAGTYKLFVETNYECNTKLVGEAFLTFTNPPNFKPVVSITQCDMFDDDPSDGLTTFNLNNSLYEITNGRPGNYDVSFYLNDSEAEKDGNNLNALPEFFSNTSPTQIITTKVYKKGTACYNLGRLELNVIPSTVIKTSDISDCFSEQGSVEFDLNIKLNEIITENSIPNDSNITFYDSIQNAIENINPISGLYTTNESKKIYFNVETIGQCDTSGSFNLIIYPPPPIDAKEETLTICDFPIIINSSIPNEFIENFIYEWSNGSNEEEIIIFDPQVLSVVITDKSTLCKISKTYQINNPPAPIISEVKININTGEVNVFTIENLDNLYALDNPYGMYQSSNTFLDVAPGVHMVYVKNKNECNIAEKKIYVLGFPKYFTPNNDSHNDTWKILGLNIEEYTLNKVHIFDRFGKLLKSLGPGSEWDGTFNGRILPSSDYWFRAEIQDKNGAPKEYLGHFTLKR